ncbi:hypothetical protein TRIUR3_13910 [Triticum urartu]|uniref:Uncharacterized protein n=1 Tax=Triticum urartu TaxID=4572 RepID=M7YUV9_TRIUA|nr:hypothetical protein TRIUR3_13910 [Triticum urartu]
MVSTLDTLSLNIQQCVVDCFNDFAMHASCSELDHLLSHQFQLIDSSFVCRCTGRCAAGSYKEVTLTRLASCDSRGNKEDGTCDCRGSGGDTDQEVVTAEYWIADFSYTVPFKKRLPFDELLKGGGWTSCGTVFQDG